jgi:hypothetical protein
MRHNLHYIQTAHWAESIESLGMSTFKSNCSKIHSGGEQRDYGEGQRGRVGWGWEVGGRELTTSTQYTFPCKGGGES